MRNYLRSFVLAWLVLGLPLVVGAADLTKPVSVPVGQEIAVYLRNYWVMMSGLSGENEKEIKVFYEFGGGQIYVNIVAKDRGMEGDKKLILVIDKETMEVNDNIEKIFGVTLAPENVFYAFFDSTKSKPILGYSEGKFTVPKD